jgi:hypothetical protein
LRVFEPYWTIESGRKHVEPYSFEVSRLHMQVASKTTTAC